MPFSPFAIRHAVIARKSPIDEEISHVLTHTTKDENGTTDFTDYHRKKPIRVNLCNLWLFYEEGLDDLLKECQASGSIRFTTSLRQGVQHGDGNGRNLLEAEAMRELGFRYVGVGI